MGDPGTRPLRSNQLLSKTASRLVVVDVQQKLLDQIPVAATLVENCRRLICGARLLDVPIAATEQYPAGLGPTVEVLAGLLDEIPEKLRFSCAECLGWEAPGESDLERDQVVICGIEAHVCVLQTALDLAARGFRVFVVVDAVASRHKLDWKTALGRLADSGIVVLTTESVLFEWCEVAGTDEFRQISRLVTGKDEA